MDLEQMVAVLVAAGTSSYGDDSKLTNTAREWLAAGFSPEDTQFWLEAGCWDVKVARAFKDADLDSEDVEFETAKPTKSTIAHKVCAGEISLNAAIRIAKSRQ